jgi:hypothetical protein
MNPNKMRAVRRPLPVGQVGLLRHRNPMIDNLMQERTSLLDLCEQATRNAMEDGNRDLSDLESKLIGDNQARVAKIDAQLKLISDMDKQRAAGDDAAKEYFQAAENRGQGGERQPTAGNGLGARTAPRAGDYITAGDVIVDQLRAVGHMGSGRDGEARDRLKGANLDLLDEARAIVNETTANVPGLLPKPIIGEIVNQIDDKRPFISSIGAKDLGGVPGKVFSRPIVTQHVAVGQQVTEKTELASQQFVVGSVDFTKNTYGGSLDVSRQVIDWTSPAAWNAILIDLQRIYGKFTENRAADDFATAIVAEVEIDSTIADPFLRFARALYGAAALVYGSVEELPNHIWMSLDMWAFYGPLIDQWTRQTANNGGGPVAGSSSPTNFGGNVLDFPRTVVPSFPSGQLIVGVKELTEVYEDRIGLLTAVEPKLLGVEIAYGGYMANGTLDVDGFAKVVDEVPAP